MVRRFALAFLAVGLPGVGLAVSCSLPFQQNYWVQSYIVFAGTTEVTLADVGVAKVWEESERFEVAFRGGEDENGEPCTIVEFSLTALESTTPITTECLQ